MRKLGVSTASQSHYLVQNRNNVIKKKYVWVKIQR